MRGVFITDTHLTKQAPSSRIDDYLTTILDKIDWVCKFCKEKDAHLFIGGDIFNSPILSAGVAHRFIEVLESNDLKVYIITGNHDVRYYSQDMVSESLLGLVYKTKNVVCLDDKVIQIDDVTVGSTWFADEWIPDADVVVAHRTFNHKNDRLYQDPALYSDSHVKLVLAGHDHDAYPEMTFGKTLFVRPGAISRSTAHRENLERDLALAYFEVTPDGVNFVKYIRIPHLPYDTVFFKKPVSDALIDIDISEISDLISRVGEVSANTDPYDILDLMGLTPDIKLRVVDRLEEVFLFRHNEQL